MVEPPGVCKERPLDTTVRATLAAIAGSAEVQRALETPRKIDISNTQLIRYQESSKDFLASSRTPVEAPIQTYV